MKKFVLGLLLSGCALGANAQGFTTDADTVKGSVYGDLNLLNGITNTGTSNIKISWKVVANDFPASWTVDSLLGICDNNLCRSNANNQLFTNTFTSSDYMPNVKGDFHLQLTRFDLSQVATGSHYITINLKDPANNEKNITYIVTKYPTGITGVTRATDNVVIYPNPANDNLNVVFDGMPEVKNIAVYNLIGKVVSVYKTTGTSAKLDLGNIPSGIYFIRLTDAQGHVTATRKFTRQ